MSGNERKDEKERWEGGKRQENVGEKAKEKSERKKRKENREIRQKKKRGRIGYFSSYLSTKGYKSDSLAPPCIPKV